MAAALNLEIVEGPDAGKQIPVQGSLLVGREESADIHLNDPRVSRRHARITATNGSATVEDLGSANGTFINHVQIHGSGRLDPGDELLLGTSVLSLRTSQQIEAQPSAVRAVPAGLRAAERPPTYVQRTIDQAPVPPSGPPQLTRLLDVRTRAQAKLAPVAMLALVAIAVVLYLATK